MSAREVPVNLRASFGVTSMAGSWGSVKASPISTESGTPQSNRGPTASAHIVRQRGNDASKWQERFLMGGNGLHDHISIGSSAAILAQAGASWDADRDVRNGVGPLCAQFATQRRGSLLGWGQSGLRLHLLSGGAACKTISSVHAA